MKHSVEIVDGYIVGAWSGLDVGKEISDDEYKELYNLLINPPKKEGYYYRLKEDKTWEEFENIVVSVPSAEEDANAMLVDLDYRLTLVEYNLI